MAQALPILVAIGKGIAAVLTAAGVSGATAAAISTFVVQTAVTMGLNAVISRFARGRQKDTPRQALTATMQLGEAPRMAAFGRTVLAGSLLDVNDYGGSHNTDKECMVIALVDHPIDALEGYYVWDAYYPFTANGVQPGFGGGLDIEFQNATPTGTAPPARFSGLGWGATDKSPGVTRIFVQYSSKLVQDYGSRPAFRWKVRGKRCYDPRKDSTVPGGSGAHRWNNPATWEWSENLIVCRNNYLWGVYFADDVANPLALWLGRGLSFAQHPATRSFAAANLCDELVALKAGGTEKRYTFGGVVASTDSYDAVDALFEEACAGVIVQREGGLELEPFAAKAVVAELTDGDFVADADQEDEDFLPGPERVNTVVGQFTDPGQKYALHALPVRRSQADVQSDGGPLELGLQLECVTSATQGQRVTEIIRRLGRNERRRLRTLPPRFGWLEEGDWIGHTTGLNGEGERTVYRIERAERLTDWKRVVALREITASAADWNPATDELADGAVIPSDTPEPGSLSLSGVTATAITREGVAGIRFSWTTPVDPAIAGVSARVRPSGGGSQVSAAATMRANDGVMEVFDGIPPSTPLQWQLEPIAARLGRATTATAWTSITTIGGRTPDDINSDLDDIADLIASLAADDRLDVTEKIALIPQIDDLMNAKAGLLASALLVGATTERTAFNNAMTALQGYLTTLTTPVLWSNLTDYTEVNGPSLANYLATALYTRTVLQNAITTRSREWGNIGGAGRPADNATVGAVLDVNLLWSSGGSAVGRAQVDNTNAGYAARKSWNFESTLEGWVPGAATTSLASGVVTLTATGADPQFYSPAISLNGRLHRYVRARIRAPSGAPGWDGTLFYTTSGHGYSFSYYKSVPRPLDLNGNDWVTVEWDMGALTSGGADWLSSVITGLRLDLGTTSGDVYEIDWIALGIRAADPITLRGIQDNADPTGSNVSAGYSGQNLASTQTYPTYAGNAAAFAALGPGKVYYDSSNSMLLSGTFDPVDTAFSISISPANIYTNVNSATTGTVQSPLVTVTPKNAVGSVTYALNKITNNYPTWTITNPSGANTFRWSYASMATNTDRNDTWQIIATDSVGNVATLIAPVWLRKYS